MLIRLGYDIHFNVPSPTPMIALLHVYPQRAKDLREPDELRTEPAVAIEEYIDSFGNRCSRLVTPPGNIRLYACTLIEDSGREDPVVPNARQHELQDLPAGTLQFLLASRYCEVDLMSNIAMELFSGTEPGWPRVAAICSWVHQKVQFGYPFARSTRTALDTYTERMGVCRDFQHLAITFCRAMNIPARYATGYLGDIGVPVDSAMDFSAWFEAYLDGAWRTFDARHNRPRIGRVLMAVGRDAADVALTTSFGNARLTQFTVVTDEVKNESAKA
ncbi:MAG TPA: transglutaminase family protein [Bryobacteraceae bacterium]|jgi:transglutaminase-like putative cysteine protease|nr:transglutaminase family protein [Bryobacteraceae bacterium]